jgi:hypothetical protein
MRRNARRTRERAGVGIVVAVAVSLTRRFWMTLNERTFTDGELTV